ncbi:hypothetical protein RHGRI_025622 [Rhododendron griersonianum]|uniref:Uncharacterized protein n=1 Tax=Rhododendron griersonianum TaxID=479676 RepID=A0AAV6IS33_9ERIC|nr:hypothetical protein RHGRI_025622 [Rhododendron griersonianum]
MVATGCTQFQDPTFNLPQQGVVSSRPLSTFGIPSQSGQHQYGVPDNADKGFRMVHGTDSLGSYGSSSFQPHENQVQKPQSAGNGANQTYQSMLQFAANHPLQMPFKKKKKKENTCPPDTAEAAAIQKGQ